MTDVAVQAGPHHVPPPRAPFERTDVLVLASAFAAAAVCAALASLAGLPKLQPLVGLIVILSLAYAISTNRRAIDRRTVAWGLGLQIVFALLVLKTTAGQRTFQSLGAVINRLLDFSFVGSSMPTATLHERPRRPACCRRTSHGASISASAV